MDLETFREEAGRMWEEIPAPFREGVEAVAVEDEAVPHPEIPGVFTLGECDTEAWPSAYAEGGDVRSSVILYHGSFRELDRRDPGFDWDAELWETLLHELLHHREFAAAERGLEVYDRALDHNFRRHAGRSFDPEFYRWLPADDEGAVRLASETFVEADRRDGQAVFPWRGRAYSLRVPEDDHVLYVNPDNLLEERLWVVVWPDRPWWRRLLPVGDADPEVREVRRRALPEPLPETPS